MNLTRLLQFAAWPIAAGVIIALLAMLVFPQLRGYQQINSAPPTATNNAPYSYADAVSRAAPAVVNIYTEKTALPRNPVDINNPYYRQRYNANVPQKTLGSGVIVDSSGLILTNNHVINGAEKIQVLLNDGRATTAQIVGIDPENDLAVLKITMNKLFAITPGHSSNIRVGDVVLAIGNPFGVGQSVSQGIVSATGRWNLGILGINSAENFIQTDAAINPGNSGGALVDANGNLIGINTAALDEAGTASVGISFAIPADTAMGSLKQIVQYGEVRHGWLGLAVSSLDSKQAEAFGTVGLIVTDVDADGPASKAGIQAGDVITHINGTAMSDTFTIKNIIAKIQPGTDLKFRILRGKKTLDINATASIFPGSRTKS
jgi:serine protease DegS